MGQKIFLEPVSFHRVQVFIPANKWSSPHFVVHLGDVSHWRGSTKRAGPRVTCVTRHPVETGKELAAPIRVRKSIGYTGLKHLEDSSHRIPVSFIPG